MTRQPVAVIFGARNVGRAVIAERSATGWQCLAVVRTEATAARLRREHPAARVLVGDAADPAVVAAAIRTAEDTLGGLDLIVNAITAPPRDQGFGGGPIADAPSDRLAAWMDGFVPMAWQIQRVGGAALRRRGAGTLVQVAGGSARRAFATRGPWGAAQFAVRALTQALAAELRGAGVHVALLIADGVIETERHPPGARPPGESLHPSDVAAAVAYLAGQSPRGWTHELVITPPLDSWTA